MTRGDRDRVEDILRSIGQLREVRELGRSAFNREWIVRSAACYELMVIGGALNALSDEFVEAYSGLPVSGAVDLRNVLTHEYFRVNNDILWDTISLDIPSLAEILSED